jgi:hypothetical protein
MKVPLDCVEVGDGVRVGVTLALTVLVELRDSPGYSVGSAEAVGALVAVLVTVPIELLDDVLDAVAEALAVAV